jgi:hypothetical protein
MSILWVRPKTGASTSISDRGQQGFRREYTAKSNTPREKRTAVLNCGMLPVYGSPHPENLAAVCVRIDAVQNKEIPYLWDVSADWQVNPSSKRDPADHQKQPDQRREKWSCRCVPVPFAPYIDLAGQLLASSAGQPFDPVIEQPIICDEITIQRYEPVCHRVTQRAYVDCVNSAVWCGAAGGTALMQNITVVDEYLAGSYWFNTTYTVLIKPRYYMTLPLGTNVIIGGWDPEFIADVGTLQWATIDNQTKLVAITRIDPITKKPFYDGRPAFLDGAGKELPRDANGIYTADPVLRPFHLKKQASFLSLNLTPPPGLEFN